MAAMSVVGSVVMVENWAGASVVRMDLKTEIDLVGWRVG